MGKDETNVFLRRFILGGLAIFIVVLAGMSLLMMTDKNPQVVTPESTNTCAQYLFINANKTPNDVAQLNIVYSLRRDYIQEIHIIKVSNDSYPKIAVGKIANLSETPVWFFSSGVTTKGRVRGADVIIKEVSNCWSKKP